ncbi:hypothetical protein ACSBR1_009658 [Camellia fascicularis]
MENFELGNAKRKRFCFNQFNSIQFIHSAEPTDLTEPSFDLVNYKVDGKRTLNSCIKNHGGSK